MQSMTETNDGFRLAEKDLELRGQGTFGRKQSGLPDFKVADLVHDYRILETARKDATEMLETKAFWQDDDYQYLRKMLEDSGVLQGERFD